MPGVLTDEFKELEADEEFEDIRKATEEQVSLLEKEVQRREGQMQADAVIAFATHLQQGETFSKPEVAKALARCAVEFCESQGWLEGGEKNE